MDDPAATPAGLMVLRLWTERGGTVRVRVTSTTDVESRSSSTVYAGSRSELLALVGAWLDELCTRGHVTGDDRTVD